MAYPTYPNTYKKDLQVGDKTITIEIGRYSEQVSGAVLVTCGETVVHSTMALGRKVNLGYFPLSVEFAEKLYSAGIIKGSRWVKRDGRPTDEAILKARVIDRSLRPLFPAGITHEVQNINTVLSYDGENDPDMLGMIGASLALSISDIPFDGPLSGIRVGFNAESGTYLFNPTNGERETSDLDMIVAGTKAAIVMVEAGANEVVEETIIEGMIQAQGVLGELCEQYEAIAKEIGKEKKELISEEEQQAAAATQALADELKSTYKQELATVVRNKAALQDSGFSELLERMESELNQKRQEDDRLDMSEIRAAADKALKHAARALILEDGVRPDGRSTDEIRQIWSEVDVLPRTHGSAMFKRGATQAITIATLGSPSLSQTVESIDGMEDKRYIHHYNMPPYASGEAGRFGFPKRREIGHGALAQRALEPMIPSAEEFPYTIHVVSEILSSNGSTSQASVCGSTLALMAAGVPIKSPVAGIAMGLMSDGEQFIVLSDIQGLEDHTGDMDFKVAGSREGITAIQMDIKLKGIPREVLERALEQARTGRLHIMDEMLKTIDNPREQLSEHAPKIVQVTIPQSKIGELIGPGGKNIRGLSEQYGVEISVEEDEDENVGMVFISGVDINALEQTASHITNLFRELTIGESFEGKVTRVESYGYFVEFLPGREGMVHVSNASVDYVKDGHDVASIGDTKTVRLVEIKDDGKLAFSALTEEEQAESDANRPQRSRGSGGRGGDNRRGGGRGRRDFGPRRNDRGGSRGGDNRRRQNRGGRQSGSRDRDRN